MIIFLETPFLHHDLTALHEGKGLHSFDAGQDDIRQAVLDVGFKMDNRGWRTRRRGTTAVSKKQFDGLQERLYKGILEYTRRFIAGQVSGTTWTVSIRSKKGTWRQYEFSGTRSQAQADGVKKSKEGETFKVDPSARQPRESKVSKSRWLQWVRHLLRESYQTAFSLGMKSSGAEEVRAGVAARDEKWVESAVRQELKFFNRLLKQIETGTFRGVLEKRIKAYSEALQNVFYSGRVMGTPEGHLIDWLGPNDRNTDTGCRFLIEHSPYTKETLPSTPRAGDTRCLNSCRCRLVVRYVGQQKFEAVQRSHRSKQWYQEKLARLKANRTL